MNDPIYEIVVLLIKLVAAPFILFRMFFFEIGDFVVFDILQLGPFLPITF